MYQLAADPKSPASCRSMNIGTWVDRAPGPSPSSGIRRAVAAWMKTHSSLVKKTG
jgi:hypothetical protein